MSECLCHVPHDGSHTGGAFHGQTGGVSLDSVSERIHGIANCVVVLGGEAGEQRRQGIRPKRTQGEKKRKRKERE